MKHVYSKLAITLFGFAALSSYAQTDNNQSVTVNGRIVNSATDGGEPVQTISGKKSAVVNGTVITHNGETTYISSGSSSSDKVNAPFRWTRFLRSRFSRAIIYQFRSC